MEGTVQALWHVAPEVLECTPASVTKASVTLAEDSGLVLQAQMCPAFFPLEVADTGTSGPSPPTPHPREAFAADPVSLPGCFCLCPQGH